MNSVTETSKVDDTKAVKKSKERVKDEQLGDQTVINGIQWDQLKKKLVDPEFDKKTFLSQLNK